MSFIIIFLSVQAFVTFVSLVGIYRTNRTGKLRRAMLKIIFEHWDYEWRVKEYEKVSFDRMVLSFWKPVKASAFYKNLNFLNGHSIQPVLSPWQLEQKS